MISLYTGTPGSGKSLHTADEMYKWLTVFKKPVIANFPIQRRLLRYSLKQLSVMKKHPQKKYKPRKHSSFYYFSDEVLSPELLVRFSHKYLIPRKEHQALIVIDECSSDLLFSNRNWQAKNRSKWMRFFQQHRKLGFDIILISQSDKLIDKQIRCFVEYEVKHRKATNFKAFFRFVALFCGGSLFVAVTFWYGQRERIGSVFFKYKKLLGEFYDSYFEFK